MTSHLLIFFTLIRIGRVQFFRYLTCEVHLISSMSIKIDRGHLKVPRKVVPSRGARFAKRQVFSRGELGEDVDDEDDGDDGGDEDDNEDGLQNTKFSLDESWGRSSSHTSDTNMDRGIFFSYWYPTISVPIRKPP